MKKTLFIISLISVFLLTSGCISYLSPHHQVLLNKLDDLGFHDHYAIMPSGQLNTKLNEKGYTLLDEYASTKLYINPKVKDKYIVTSYWRQGYNGKYEMGWGIIAIDEQIPDEWEGKKEYNN